MNLSVNGQSQVPPGFRFHPTEEELLQYYLKKKVANQKIDLDFIQDIDLNKLEPWDIQEKCRIGSAPQSDCYFFSQKDRKYPTGVRTNRATAAGFWKATGRDKLIWSSSRLIGWRKTLVFYMGRAPHGEKSDWIMHEYRLDDNNNTIDRKESSSIADESAATEEGWVVCRVFKKKNYVKALESTTSRSTSDSDLRTQISISATHDLDPYIKKTKTNTSMRYNNVSINPSLTDMDMVQESFLHLPQLKSPTGHITDPVVLPIDSEHQVSTASWVELDRLVAYQLNGQFEPEASESTRQLSCFNSTTDPGNDINLIPFSFTDHDQLYWSFTKASFS